MKSIYTGETISIHAPTRGATKWDGYKDEKRDYFNPRSYKRSDLRNLMLNVISDKFQSTLLQEERQEYEGFNDDEVDISIHAPTRGATHPALSMS